MSMARSTDPPKLISDVPRLPPRPDDMHKGQAGRVAIVAGSRGMSGAAVLAGLGALRGGAGLVRVLTPESVQPIVAAGEPCLMSVGLAESSAGQMSAAALPALLESLTWADAVALGPGVGVSDSVAALIVGVAKEFAGPLVIDADGLNNLAARPRWWSDRAGRATVVTPHAGEMSRLRSGAGLAEVSGDDDDQRRALAIEFAAQTGTTVVLKGRRTVVTDAQKVYVNTTGNPGMATGGMGDVLTGLIAALIGQGMSPFGAACLGVYAHGMAADRLAAQIGPVGYLAREVADALPAELAVASRPPVGFK
jgi:NAD(P)H-hydrate epimerase